MPGGKKRPEDSYALGLGPSIEVARKIRAELLRRNMTQTELATRMNVRIAILSDLLSEAGRRRWQRHLIQAAAASLGMTERDLLPPSLNVLAFRADAAPEGLLAFLERHADRLSYGDAKRLQSIQWTSPPPNPSSDALWLGMLNAYRANEGLPPVSLDRQPTSRRVKK